jgi:hypothetical protein
MLQTGRFYTNPIFNEVAASTLPCRMLHRRWRVSLSGINVDAAILQIFPVREIWVSNDRDAAGAHLRNRHRRRARGELAGALR